MLRLYTKSLRAQEKHSSGWTVRQGESKRKCSAEADYRQLLMQEHPRLKKVTFAYKGRCTAIVCVPEEAKQEPLASAPVAASD